MKSNIEVISDLLSEQIGCTQKERMEQYSKWNIYWNHIAKHQNANESNGMTQNIISVLNAQEEQSKECEVLEIGCGTGAYTLNFAANYKHVTAVDMSEQMLCVLKQRAEEDKITNITYRQSLFENLPENKQYDFVFAAMCPAICDYESLMKFERLSKNHCCLVSVAKNSSYRPTAEGIITGCHISISFALCIGQIPQYTIFSLCVPFCDTTGRSYGTISDLF